MAILTPYHQSLQRLLQEQPGAGTRNAWLFRAAYHLRDYHDAKTVHSFLKEWCAQPQHNDRRFTDSEIERAVSRAFALESDIFQSMRASELPGRDDDFVAAVVQHTPPLFELEDLGIEQGRLLPALYSTEDLICAGRAKDQGWVKPLREILPAAAGCQFIVPNPMSAKTGTNRDGKSSYRCLDNTGPRKFLIIENDAGTKEEQIRLLSFLATQAPLWMVVDSGGKSLHGWFKVEGVSEQDARGFFIACCALGADHAMWAKCQWARMPGGLRPQDNALPVRQKVIYVCEELEKDACA